MTKNKPAALMSYVHSDDRYEQLSTLRDRLSVEVQMQIGIEFPIFQDKKDIHWGQNWEERIKNALTEEITFLIPSSLRASSTANLAAMSLSGFSRLRRS